MLIKYCRVFLVKLEEKCNFLNFIIGLYSLWPVIKITIVTMKSDFCTWEKILG